MLGWAWVGRRTIVGAVVAASTLGCESDPLTLCKYDGCEDGFEIFASSNGTLPEGEYHFELTFDGRTAACDLSVPKPSNASAYCDQEEHEATYIEDAQTHFFIKTLLTPRNVRIEIQRDGVVVGSAEYQPRYNSTSPNGGHCNDPCVSWDDQELELAP